MNIRRSYSPVRDYGGVAKWEGRGLQNLYSAGSIPAPASSLRLSKAKSECCRAGVKRRRTTVHHLACGRSKLGFAASSRSDCVDNGASFHAPVRLIRSPPGELTLTGFVYVARLPPAPFPPPPLRFRLGEAISDAVTRIERADYDPSISCGRSSYGCGRPDRSARRFQEKRRGNANSTFRILVSK